MLLPLKFDHLVIAVPNLAESVEQCHHFLGVRPVPGGSHPGLGTANALLGLETAGPDTVGSDTAGRDQIYLEILGPDPQQDPELARSRLAGITGPTVQRWAIRPDDFDGLVTAAALSRKPHVDLGEAHDMTRRTPNGDELEWRLTRRTPLALRGIQPFLIDWKDSLHPSQQAMPAVRLEKLWATSPDVDATLSVLRFLGTTIEVEAGVNESLHATLKGPGGSWTI